MTHEKPIPALRDLIDRACVASKTGDLQGARLLTALALIAEHVCDELDGDLDAPIDAGGLVSVVCEVLQGCGLWPDASQVDYAGLARNYLKGRDRGLVAVSPEGDFFIPLADDLSVSTRAGNVLARLLAANASGYRIVMVRSGSTRPKKTERDAAERIAAAARLVDIPVSGITLATPKGEIDLIDQT